MKNIHRFSISLAAALLLFAGCKKKDNEPAIPVASYFMPLQVGKYVTWRVDSLNFYYYGQLDTVTSYLMKDVVETAGVDNQGRPSWTIVRYMNDTAAKGPWVVSQTTLVTPTIRSVEVMENNLRVISLAYPVVDGYSWKGNTYLPYTPWRGLFKFSDGNHLSIGDWTFTLKDVNKPMQVRGKNYDSTATVEHVNTAVNAPVTSPGAFGSMSFWTETYAKNVGLIYRRTRIWEYQPPTPNGTQDGYKIGFELTMRIADHN